MQPPDLPAGHMFATIRTCHNKEGVELLRLPNIYLLPKMTLLVGNAVVGMWWLVLIVFLKTRKQIFRHICNELSRLRSSKRISVRDWSRNHFSCCWQHSMSMISWTVWKGKISLSLQLHAFISVFFWVCYVRRPFLP